MDLTSLLGSLLGNKELVSTLEDQAVKHGVPASAVSEFTQGAEQILADGKVSKEEVMQQLLAHAEAKGVPAAAVEKAIGALQQK